MEREVANVLTKIKVRVLCADRLVCPDVISEMSDLGFTDIREVFNKADADIIAKLTCKDVKELDIKFETLFTKTGKKIGQVSYNHN